MMWDELEKAGLSSKNTPIFLHEKTEFVILTGTFTDFTQKPLICIGSTPFFREWITLNPKNSSLLEMSFLQFMQKPKDRDVYNLETLFSSLSSFIKNELFTLSLSNESAIFLLIKNWQLDWQQRFLQSEKSYPYSIIIPIDYFLSTKIGSCRHLSLVTAYFLARLCEENVIPKGKVYYQRNSCQKDGHVYGHAWNLYVPDDHSTFWHIDTSWGITRSMEEKEMEKFLKNTYGLSFSQ